MLSSEEFELRTTTLVYGGDALARLPDGRAVFIPYALPDELLRVRLVEEKQRYARGVISRIVEPSPDRIEPRCRHFTECGGCHYQHIPYPAQLRAKEAILEDQLRRVGKLDAPAVKPIRPSPLAWNYRNQIQFHLAEDGSLGFLKGRSSEIVPIQECHLPEESLGLLWPEFNLDYIPDLERISLRSGEEGQDALILLESQGEEAFEFSVDLPLSAVLQGPGGEIVLSGDDFTIIPVLDFPFVVSAGSFFQTNTRVAESLAAYLLEVLPLEKDSVVLDVYCGVGLFSAFMAPLVKKVIAVESSPSACQDFLYNLSEFENVELYDLPAEDLIPHLALSPDLIVLDPPRAGLSKAVLDGAAGLGPELIAYVSCDPATLARDLGRFSRQGYVLEESTPFDMFPQTYHIESLNILRRSSAQG